MMINIKTSTQSNKEMPRNQNTQMMNVYGGYYIKDWKNQGKRMNMMI